MSTNQELRQISVRAVSGSNLDYNGDWSALFDQALIAKNLDWNGRLLTWINLKLAPPTPYANLPSAQAAWAANFGARSWNELGTFSAV
jgi:hypothetical protein